MQVFRSLARLTRVRPIVTFQRTKVTISNEDHKLRQFIIYHHVERIYTDLKELGYRDNDPLKLTDLIKLDQWHYNGTEPVDAAIKLLGIREGARVLDVGSGIGGPSRYLAHKANCHVTASELLPDNHRVGQDLTSRCGMTGSVKHMCGDITTTELGKEEFDHVVSFQAVCYVEDKLRLFRHLSNSLKPGGTIYFDELCRLKDIENTEEQVALDLFLFGLNTLPTHRDYRMMLEEAGFKVTVQDISDSYKEFTHKRWKKWVEQREKSVRLYGEDMVQGWLKLYVTAKKLCNEFGLMGGGRFVARKV
ncbi:uncharacterized protein LOC144861166 isoform X2 [Branchiostoma floridae x Branchiostoma japonicum]